MTAAACGRSAAVQYVFFLQMGAQPITQGVDYRASRGLACATE